MGNVEVVKSAYEAFGRGDVAEVLALLADDVDWSAPMTLPHGGHFHGKDAVGGFFQGIGATWDPLRVELRQIAALSEDTVIAVVEATGTLRSGGPGGYGAAHQFTLRDGKVTAFQEYVDLDKPLSG